jgi:hypothetical protein
LLSRTFICDVAAVVIVQPAKQKLVLLVPQYLAAHEEKPLQSQLLQLLLLPWMLMRKSMSHCQSVFCMHECLRA